MPYIAPEDRIRIESEHQRPYLASPGELNYAITRLILEYMQLSPLSYKLFNEVIGALECCKLELYRRLVATYEDKKIEANGDVYPKL
jgi:hypothetical protein